MNKRQEDTLVMGIAVAMILLFLGGAVAFAIFQFREQSHRFNMLEIRVGMEAK